MDMDITRSLPFATDTVSKILIEHCLEHVDSCDGMRFLIEAHRVLEPGGVLQICVPILNRPTQRRFVISAVTNRQRQIYSEDSLWLFLKRAGFDTSEPTERKEIDCHWRDIGVELENLETLRLEATK